MTRRNDAGRRVARGALSIAIHSAAMPHLQRLIAALWFGSAVFLMLAASAAFRAAGHPTIAADVVGSMLTRWHYIALLAPLALFVLELRNVRRTILLLLFASVLLAAAQAFVDLRIRAIRAAALQPMSELSTDDPVRRRFGMLHGVSMMLLALQAISAGVVVAARDVQKNEVMPTEETPQPPPDNAQYEAPPEALPATQAPPATENDEPTVASEGHERGTNTTGGGP